MRSTQRQIITETVTDTSQCYATSTKATNSQQPEHSVVISICIIDQQPEYELFNSQRLIQYSNQHALII